MPAAVMPASLEHIEKTFDVRVRVGVRVFQRIAHAGLRREMNDHGETVLRKQRFRRCAIGKVRFHEGEAVLTLQDIDARLFQGWIVVVVDAVQANDPAAGSEQTLRDMEADEAGSAGDQDGFVAHDVTGPAL